MTLFEKILIATDGSENNQTAVEEGIKIAHTCGSSVYVVYVRDRHAGIRVGTSGCGNERYVPAASE
ncbi:universal stress protein [Methanosphaerula subterraneus]|uniref:universal stress protein n=1 Tax=Methanosphaerula subterraneus TaxID=3350244 RepID=UPI003F876264